METSCLILHLLSCISYSVSVLLSSHTFTQGGKMQESALGLCSIILLYLPHSLPQSREYSFLSVVGEMDSSYKVSLLETFSTDSVRFITVGWWGSFFIPLSPCACLLCPQFPHLQQGSFLGGMLSINNDLRMKGGDHSLFSESLPQYFYLQNIPSQPSYPGGTTEIIAGFQGTSAQKLLQQQFRVPWDYRDIDEMVL